MSLPPAPAPAVDFEMDPCDTLIEAFEKVVDPRHRRGIRHPLPSTLALCVVALLSGRQNLTQIHRFGKANPQVLEALGFPRAKSPVPTTLSSIFGSLHVQQLQQVLAGWICGLFHSVRSRRDNAVAAVDGKTTRASRVHVLNVFALDMGQAIWQCEVDEKASEITVLRGALEPMFAAYPFLKILTGDAMFAGNPLCSEIIKHGRHYLFQIKEDQKHLHEKMELVFAPFLSSVPSPEHLTGEKKTVTPSAVIFR